MADFEVHGIRFEQDPLPVDEACVGVDLLSSADGFAKMAKVARMFAKVCRVSRTPDGRFEVGGAMVKLEPFFNDVFQRRLDLMLAFAEAAVKTEYGDFLAKAGIELQAPAPPQPKP